MTRVRFAPSPTGALHIGGVRTALFNYLFAKKTGGTFILRIEDTDQTRYVETAEEYIREALKWLGMDIDEGPEEGGKYGPYRQSERKEIYQKYIQILITEGKAYYAFDTVEALDRLREENPNFKYDSSVRHTLRNSLTLPPEETTRLIESGENYTIRLKVNPGQNIVFKDIIRGEVSFDSGELDDKVLMKSDGLPTYHFANIIDDHSMEITHVIRGEEWLSSTAHHVLLYKAFGWDQTMPVFAHLPLILKPTGKGKLSKRDGAKFDMPVFPIAWEEKENGVVLKGFREYGFNPAAVINFLAFLGWNPGTDEEILSLEQLTKQFDLNKVSKSGARFDFEKAKWYNQQYILQMENYELLPLVKAELQKYAADKEDAFILEYIELYKERVSIYSDFYPAGYYFFEDLKEYDINTWNKKFKPEIKPYILKIISLLENLDIFESTTIENEIKNYLTDSGIGPGQVFPLLRIALTGTLKGPDLMKTIALMGKELSTKRIRNSLDRLD